MQYAVKVAKNKEQLLSQPLLKSVFSVLQIYLNDAQAVTFVIDCPTRRLWLLPQFLINLMQEHAQHTQQDLPVQQFPVLFKVALQRLPELPAQHQEQQQHLRC